MNIEKKICPYCGEMIRKSYTVCEICGEELPEEKPENAMKQCPYCGSAVLMAATKCKNCGEALVVGQREDEASTGETIMGCAILIAIIVGAFYLVKWLFF